MARTLGSELHKVRKLRGLSLKAVAEPAGMSTTYLQKLERDGVKSPSPHRLRRLAETLELDFSDLFVLAGYPASPGEKDAPRATARQKQTLNLGTAKGSLLRHAFQSETQVTDDELEQLANYLLFLRQQSGEEPR
jgi:transcriptional regulator with XRE-family HTH domain